MVNVARALMLALVIAVAAPVAQADTVKERFNEKITNSEIVLKEALQRSGHSIPEEIIRRAKAIAIFPNTFKAGFVFGVRYGEGILMAQGEDKTWSAPAYFTISSASAGFQAGLQDADIVLLIMNDKGLKAFFKQKMTFGADINVTAGPESWNADGDKDIALRADIYSYSRSRGIFAGISLNGARIAASNRFNKDFYGNAHSVDDIVINRTVQAPAEAASLIGLLNGISKK